jgi:hypothetical protein
MNENTNLKNKNTNIRAWIQKTPIKEASCSFTRIHTSKKFSKNVKLNSPYGCGNTPNIKLYLQLSQHIKGKNSSRF